MYLIITSYFNLLIFFIIHKGKSLRTFPDDFKFGVATAAYQVEGGWNEDGKGEGLWDYYTHKFPFFIKEQHNGNVACDSYHKWETDIQMLKYLGVDFYRFSIAWTRIFPNGFNNNKINFAGVNYYKKLIKGLQDNSIEPLVTLYHWDLPTYLHQLGGWANPKLVDYFADYAKVVFSLFPEVKYWTTFNEPSTFCTSAFTGKRAPFYNSSAFGIYRCAYTIVKAHAKAYHIYHDDLQLDGKVSIVLVSDWAYPGSNSTKDQQAFERFIQFNLGLYANPIYNGDFPEIVKKQVAKRSAAEGFSKSRLPQFTEDEIKQINGTFDYFALNYYSATMVEDNYTSTDKEPTYPNDMAVKTYNNPEWFNAQSKIWVASVPDGFRQLLKWVKQNYGNPEIIITENGIPDDNGTLEDDHRIFFLKSHLTSVLEAIYEDKVNVKGYTFWSLMDNFEWTFGYTLKFGIYHVNFDNDNRTRTIKKSGEWYKNLTRTHCLMNQCESAASSIYANLCVFYIIIMITISGALM